MRSTLVILLLGSAVAGCQTPGGNTAARGVEPVNVPVLARETFVFDAEAPAGVLPASEVARLTAWFDSLEVGYGDSIFVDGVYADAVRGQVADIAGNYGLSLAPSAPVTAGMIAPGSVRVIVSRTRAEVPNCPNWSVQSTPTTDNRTHSNWGCGINSALAAMVADPQDLFRGHDVGPTSDDVVATKAVKIYRNRTPSGNGNLKTVSSKGN